MECEFREIASPCAFIQESIADSGRFPGSLSYIRGLSANKVLPDLIGSCSNFKTLGNHPYVGPNKFWDLRPYEYTGLH